MQIIRTTMGDKQNTTSNRGRGKNAKNILFVQKEQYLQDVIKH